MKNVINTLGIFILTVIITAIPILCTCSYLLNWVSFIKFILSMLTVLEMVVIGGFLYAEVEKENGNDD